MYECGSFFMSAKLWNRTGKRKKCTIAEIVSITTKVSKTFYKLQFKLNYKFCQIFDSYQSFPSILEQMFKLSPVERQQSSKHKSHKRHVTFCIISLFPVKTFLPFAAIERIIIAHLPRSFLSLLFPLQRKFSPFQARDRISFSKDLWINRSSERSCLPLTSAQHSSLYLSR